MASDLLPDCYELTASASFGDEDVAALEGSIGVIDVKQEVLYP